ncbi:hypothetical protein HanXRQr2_Chr16g0760921 [Helianthus annuus]|uniref:Uncharacterized protein n=1 Tax=Helianthus annuus TaxID=4232 RepID=A0A251S0Q9_HELAN|nr:hypothetical protein HanXRQr2_Chr16g0760921 [Helianthus annuus]
MYITIHNCRMVLHDRGCQIRGGLKASPRWAGAPPGEKKFSAKFRRKSRPHPLKFSSAPLGIFRPRPLDFFVRTP